MAAIATATLIWTVGIPIAKWFVTRYLQLDPQQYPLWRMALLWPAFAMIMLLVWFISIATSDD